MFHSFGQTSFVKTEIATLLDREATKSWERVNLADRKARVAVILLRCSVTALPSRPSTTDSAFSHSGRVAHLADRNASLTLTTAERLVHGFGMLLDSLVAAWSNTMSRLIPLEYCAVAPVRHGLLRVYTGHIRCSTGGVTTFCENTADDVHAQYIPHSVTIIKDPSVAIR